MCINVLASQYLCDMFTSTNHSYNTRNASQPKQRKTRTAYHQRSFNVFGLIIWNRLSLKLKTALPFVTSRESSWNTWVLYHLFKTHIVLICFITLSGSYYIISCYRGHSQYLLWTTLGDIVENTALRRHNQALKLCRKRLLWACIYIQTHAFILGVTGLPW